MSLPSSLPHGAASLPRLTFSVKGENHTLGNAVRSILTRKVGVCFAGYAVPHPTQQLMNIRVQTTGRPAVELLRESVMDLSEICECLLELYENEENAFEASHPGASQARQFFADCESSRGNGPQKTSDGETEVLK